MSKREIQFVTEGVVIDIFLLYQFIRRLATPFEKWDAFKLGIIDKNGKVLKKKSSLKTREEKNAWGFFDILVANLKKLLSKVPGGRSRLASFAAALLLLKEKDSSKLNDKEYLIETFLDIMDDITLDEEYRDFLCSTHEQVAKALVEHEHIACDPMFSLLMEEPVNSVGTGNIAGTGHDGEDPAVPKKKKKKKKKAKDTSKLLKRLDKV